MKSRQRYVPMIAALLLLGGIVKAQTVEIPFEFIHSEIVVKISINGKGPFNAMIDTGTDPSAIDITTARQIGIELSTKSHRSAGGGTDVNLTYACKMSKVTVGNFAAADVEAGAINLAKVSERMGVNIDAILGYSVLKKQIVQFDYPRSVVRFFERPPARGAVPNAVTLTFRYKDNVLIDGILVNGKPVTANLDTGSNGSVQLSPRAIKKIGLSDEAARGKPKISVGYNGEHETREGTIKNVTIGTISVNDVPATFFTKGTGHDNVPWSINIGNAFMKDYVVTVDYIAMTVTFASNKQ